jgi:hypothetical protein
MAFDITNNVNSAIISGTLGFNRARQGINKASLNITEASINIAQRNNYAAQTTQDVLANAASQQIGQIRKLLPQGSDNFTNNILSLQINSRNALASTKVLGVASKTVGRIIDELA